MADEVDVAAMLQEEEIAALLEKNKKEMEAREGVLNFFKGYCLNCDEKIDEGRFCDPDCQHDYERRTRR